MTQEKDYVLGTHDDEIARLGLQHRVWREHTVGAWRRAGFTVGQTLVDIGCGPGYAALDLAELVGPQGRVVAVDRSRRFLSALESEAGRRGLTQIEIHEQDLDAGDLPVTGADGAWSRWVFAFVNRPLDLLDRAARALRPGGALVSYEYFDYRAWRFAPRSEVFENFVRVVMESWRANGGEPDIALDLARGLGERGFELRHVRPIVEVVTPGDSFWQWPRAFVNVGVERLVDLGRLTPQAGREIVADFTRREAAPHTHMITPGVLEIVAIKR